MVSFAMMSYRLHDEINIFVGYMKPTEAEQRAREDLVRRFTDLVESFDLSVSVRCFGSYVTGLYTPISDIDMVLVSKERHRRSESSSDSKFDPYAHNPGNNKPNLESVLHHIQLSGFASHITSLLQAKVPIIKVTDAVTGIVIDLIDSSHEVHAVASTEAVQRWTRREFDFIRAIVLVVKIFLAIRKAGTTYTGGINSYVLVWMVVAWVELELPKISRSSGLVGEEGVEVEVEVGLDEGSDLGSDSDSSQSSGAPCPHLAQGKPAASVPAYLRKDLGRALMLFFRFWGEDFDYASKAVRFNPVLGYGSKYRFGFPTSGSPEYLFCIIDPANRYIDLGEKAYAIKHIRETFRKAYVDLCGIMEKGSEVPRGGSLLNRVLKGDFRQFVLAREAII